MKLYIDDILPKICTLIKRKRLTDCLECLEGIGSAGDSSLILLAYLQGEVKS